MPSVDVPSGASGSSAAPTPDTAPAPDATPRADVSPVVGSRPDARLVAAVATGTILNPLNSSMIAVALVPIAADFGAGTTTSTWLISGFFLAAAIAMPLMGRFADLFGPKRTFVTGLALVGISGAIGTIAPSFALLVLCRVLMAFGTSTAYPSGLAIFRARDPDGNAPAGALAILGIAASVMAAAGPVLGGVIVGTVGWQGIFLINVPIVLVGLVIAVRWLPADPPATVHVSFRSRAGVEDFLDTIDMPGIAFFAVMVVGVLAFLVALPTEVDPPLIGVAAAGVIFLVARELNARRPFVDLRMLARQPTLIWLYAQFAGVNLVFYGVFFGLPIWLEDVLGFSAAQAGMLLLPLAGIGILASPVAARIVSRRGPAPAIIIGSVALLVGSIPLMAFGDATPVAAILVVGAILGLPTAFNNLGLQAALYEATPASLMGTASGQFQTFRYTGAIAASAVLGIVFAGTPTSEGFDRLAIVLVVVSAILVVASIGGARLARRTPLKPMTVLEAEEAEFVGPVPPAESV
jgi:MFS family permease